MARNAVLNARASWPGRLIVQKNSLATFIPAAPGTGTPWELLWNSRPDVAGQMLYWCYGDTTYRVNGGVPIDPSTALVNSVNKGVAYGMKYIEIYRVDVLNLLTATHYAHTALSSVGRALVTDFNSDGHPDYVLHNANTRQTAIWYLNNNVYIGSAYGPTLVAGWALRDSRIQSRQPFRLCALRLQHASDGDLVFVWTNIHRKRLWAELSQWLGVGRDRRF